MKFELSVKEARTWSIEKFKNLSDDDRYYALIRATQKDLESRKFLEESGFDVPIENLYYGTDTYYKLLETVKDNFPLLFHIRIKLSKKEADKQKAFMLSPRSIIPLKNDLSYNGKVYPIKEKCIDGEYEICYYQKGAVMGSVKWKDNYFKASEYDHILLSCSDAVRSLILKEQLSGFEFGTIFNITKKVEEPFYNIVPKNQCSEYAIVDKLAVEKYREDYDCRFVNFDGIRIYEKGSLDNIEDIMFTKEATGCKKGDIIVSQRFRQFYIKNNLKGLDFKPTFEVGTELFEEYDEFIKEFSKDLVAFNENHRIGIFNEIPASKLINGIL